MPGPGLQPGVIYSPFAPANGNIQGGIGGIGGGINGIAGGLDAAGQAARPDRMLMTPLQIPGGVSNSLIGPGLLQGGISGGIAGISGGISGGMGGAGRRQAPSPQSLISKMGSQMIRPSSSSIRQMMRLGIL